MCTEKCMCIHTHIYTVTCPLQGPPSLPIPRAPTHQGDLQGPSLPGAGTRSPGVLSLGADSGAWWEVPSPLPGVQPEAFPAGDTVPPPLALPQAGLPALHSAKAVGTHQGLSVNYLGGQRRAPPHSPSFQA